MIKWLYAIDDIISTFALSVIILLIGFNVFFRFVLNDPIPWTEEVSLGLFVWLVFIGVSSAMKRNSHIGVDFFVNKMPKPFRILCSIIRAAAIYYVLIYVFIYIGYYFTLQAVNKVTPVLKISYQLIDIAVPLGGILTAIHFTRIFIHSFHTQYRQEGGS
jgi:TRAP-type transport system small permease protein